MEDLEEAIKANQQCARYTVLNRMTIKVWPINLDSFIYFIIFNLVSCCHMISSSNRPAEALSRKRIKKDPGYSLIAIRLSYRLCCYGLSNKECLPFRVEFGQCRQADFSAFMLKLVQSAT